MARAKRTDRTEARRRYRAEQAALVTDDEDTTDDATTTTSQRASAKPAAAQPMPRPSIRAAFTGAIRPVDLRGDLRSIRIVVLNLGFLGVLAGSVAIAILFVVAYSGAMAAIPVGTATVEQMSAALEGNPFPYQLFSLVLLSPPPIVGALVIGFMARRASWLGGLIYGTVSVLLLLFVLQTPAGRMVTTDGQQSSVEIIAGYAAFSPVGTALFASAAAAYRRFLELANPNRNQRQQAKPQSGRGNMKPARR